MERSYKENNKYMIIFFQIYLYNMQEFNIIIDSGDNAKKIMIHYKSQNLPTDKEITEIVYKHTHAPVQSIEQTNNFFFVKCQEKNESVCKIL